MKTQNQKTQGIGASLATVALAAAMLASPAILSAEPEKKQPEKNVMAERMAKLLEEMQAEGKSRTLTPEEAQELFGDEIERMRRQMEERAQDEGDDESEDKEKAKNNALEGFMGFLQRGARGRKAGKNEKEHSSVMDEYRPVVKEAALSTVEIYAGNKQLALGTIVNTNGFILTKASEVEGKKLRCRFPGGMRVSAELLDVYKPLDLALVKVQADGLAAIKWGSNEDVELGTFLAAPGIGEQPIAIGVASVAPRSLSETTKGFLGVTPEGTDDGVRLRDVLKGTPAAKAGLKIGDYAIAVDGKKVGSRVQFHQLIAGRLPGEEVEFTVRRGDEELKLVAKLVSREEYAQETGGGNRSNPRSDRMNSMGGDLSDKRNGFTIAMQTDLTLEPEQCGGPLVNLDGEVVGVNIARGGRVKSYAVPSSKLRGLLENVTSGKFTITDVRELKKAVDVADEALEKAEAALKAAKQAKKLADEALKAAGKR